MRNNRYKTLLFWKVPLRQYLTAGLCTLLLMSFSSLAFGQQMEVTGTVTDDFTGETLIGVNIMIVGTTLGTTTDLNGEYSLTVPGPDAQLRFSYYRIYNTNNRC